jgi:hypothetical protein
MNFNLVEMYNGLLRFNKHILNELAEGLKHLPNLEYCAIQALCYIEYANFDNQAALNTNLTSDGFKQGGLGAGVTNLAWDRWTAFNGNNPIVQTYWTAEHNIGNGSTNGDHYELGNYNTDGSNLNTYPAVYRGILNFFGDIWTFIRDVVIVNRNANYNSVYLLKKGVNHADITIDNIQDKCYFIGDQANSNNFITEFDFRFGPYFIPNKVGTNKKADYNWIIGNGQDTDKAVRVLLLGGRAADGSWAGSGRFFLVGFGRILGLMPASLPQLSLIK